MRITAETERGQPYVLSSYPAMLLDDESAVCSGADFAKLPAYNASMPTGKYPGKCWRRFVPDDPQGHKDVTTQPGKWLLGAYEPCDDPGYLLVRWRNLMVIE